MPAVSSLPSPPMDYETAISEGVRWSLEAQKPPSEVLSAEVLSDLSPEAYEALALYGWVSSVNNSLHDSRRAVRVSGSAPRTGGHPVNGPRIFRLAWIGVRT